MEEKEKMKVWSVSWKKMWGGLTQSRLHSGEANTSRELSPRQPCPAYAWRSFDTVSLERWDLLCSGQESALVAIRVEREVMSPHLCELDHQ